MTIIKANGLPYHLTIQGSGPPLVLLHGFTGSSENWAAHQAHLAGDYRTIAIDILGHGRSAAPADPARYQMAHCAADIAAVMEQLAAEPVHLLGYSMGGRLALYLALNRPDLVRTLLLESASPGLETEDERRERVQRDTALADVIEAEGIERFIERWERIPLFASQARLPAAVRQNLRRQRLQNRAHGLANSLRGMGTGAQPSLWPALPKLEIPLLLMAGELDAKFTALAQRMAAATPRATLAIVPEAGHTIHLEQAAVFQAELLSFLAAQS